MRRVFGFFVRALGAAHLAIASYHAARKRVHDARAKHHEERERARLEEAATIDTAATTLAPVKPKKPKSLPPAPPSQQIAAKPNTAYQVTPPARSVRVFAEDTQ